MEKKILFVLTGFISGATIGTLVFYNLTGNFPPYELLFLLLLGSGILGICLQGLLYQVSKYINNSISWQSQFSLRFALDFIINSIVAIAFCGVVLLLVMLSISEMSLSQIWQSSWQGFLTMWVIAIVFVIVYNIVMLAFYAYYHYAEGQISEIKLERRQLKLQFEALKNQLSPHYLFNSLNTISSLIHQDKDSAEEFIRRLADTYQYILTTHKQQLVSLSEEIEFVKAYYYLLCVRFQEGLKLELNIPNQLNDSRIPPLTLQILVENAIKHNVFSKENPLIIYLGVVDNTEIRVMNNKTEAPPNVRSTKIGLSNIELRYSFFTSNKVKIIDSTNFEVKVPILKNEDFTEAA